ncbi:2'-5' RNA ligase family protein [Rhodococcus sp. HNM0569]|uniref:2'-5' RNA ligase family protein n=1 Tax=Rhodococcus sp. HNM0569 TaxID=2716340 RepID=UPI001469FE87|nr:2'-5' RNA ligase family protein [Rhodococcus sp. HNM0569]NLU83035.1 2'-5' RNA ligase family protein [Rhodococcus sp. HNM0569]
MVQSVELLLDPDTDAAVRAQWAALWDRGIASLHRVQAESNRPHVTLFVAHAIPDEAEEALRRAFSPQSLPIRLGGLICFGSRHVTVARQVVPTASLLSLQRSVFDVAVGTGEKPRIPPHIAPGHWTPHVTLSRRVRADRLGEVVTTVGGDDLDGHGVALRRWDGDAKREWLLTPPP